MKNFLTRDKAFYNSFFRLTSLMALQNVITCSVSLADNLMLGTYSETALSGVALANQIQFLLYMLVLGVGDGIIVLAAQYWGKKDTKSVQKLMSIGLWVGILIAGVFFVAVCGFPEFCLKLFTDDAAVIAEGKKYLKIICFSYLFFAMTNISLAALKSVETVKIGFFVSFSTLCINILLNSLLIYDRPGFVGLGAAGAAIATLVSRAVEFCIVLFFVLLLDKKIHFRPKYLLRVDKGLFKDYLGSGVPVLLSGGLWGVAMAVQLSILGHLGATAIAANSVAATVFQILTVVVYGSAGASAVLMGKTIGEGKMHLIREYTRTFQVLFLVIGLATGAGLFAVRDLILSFYEISPAAKEMAGQFITILSVTVVGTAYQCPCLTGVVRGGGDTKFVLYNDMIFMWGFVLPFSAAAAFWWQLPPVMVFVILKCDQILKSFVAFVKVNRYSWVRTLTREEETKK